MFMVVSVSAVPFGDYNPSAGISFVTPSSGNYSGDIDVEWTNSGSFTGLILQVKADTCSETGDWINFDPEDETEYVLDTEEYLYEYDTHGDACLRIKEGSTTYAFVGIFIDNEDPDANFDWSPVDTMVFEDVDFDASDSDDNGGSGIANYTWDFGDGETETNSVSTTTHVYDEADTYEVSLTVTDNAGNQDTTSHEIEIEDIETETETFEYEAGILGITGYQLDEEFDTGLPGTSLICSVVPTSDEITNVAVSQSGSDCTIIETPNIPYNERGVHEIIIKATEGSEIKYYSVTITVYTWWIDLEEGWNLISIPMMPEDTSIDSVLGGIQENIVDNGENTIFQYDAAYGSSGKWYKAKPTSTWTGTLDDIVPGYGYWIKMANDDAILKGFGDIAPTMGGPLLSVDVVNGWNLIGYYGLGTSSIYYALSSLRLGITTRYYDTVFTTTSNMKTGVGYWMTAKFIPNGETGYTPSQRALNSVL